MGRNLGRVAPFFMRFFGHAEARNGENSHRILRGNGVGRLRVLKKPCILALVLGHIPPAYSAPVGVRVSEVTERPNS